MTNVIYKDGQFQTEDGIPFEEQGTVRNLLADQHGIVFCHEGESYSIREKVDVVGQCQVFEEASSTWINCSDDEMSNFDETGSQTRCIKVARIIEEKEPMNTTEPNSAHSYTEGYTPAETGSDSWKHPINSEPENNETKYPIPISGTFGQQREDSPTKIGFKTVSEPENEMNNIEKLNERQTSGLFHPYTCGNNSDHILIAKQDGWHCPECDYKQPFRGDQLTAEGSEEGYPITDGIGNRRMPSLESEPSSVEKPEEKDWNWLKTKSFYAGLGKGDCFYAVHVIRVINRYESRISELEKENAQLKESVDKLVHRNIKEGNDLDNEIWRLNGVINGDKKAIDAEVIRLRDHVEEYHDKYVAAKSEYRNKIAEIEKENELLKMSYGQKIVDNSDAAERIAELESERDQLAVKVKELENKNECLNNVIEDMKKEKFGR